MFYHKNLKLLEITEKELQKSPRKLKKYKFQIFTENICSACNPMQVVAFLQTCIKFVDQRLKRLFLVT